jgi:hypothetical protein
VEEEPESSEHPPLFDHVHDHAEWELHPNPNSDNREKHKVGYYEIHNRMEWKERTDVPAEFEFVHNPSRGCASAGASVLSVES